MAPDNTIAIDCYESLGNRELAWLAFARRVLSMVEDPTLPLLERVKFLGIMGVLHDEYFTKRASRLKHQIRKRPDKRSMDGRTPAEERAACSIEVEEQLSRTYRVMLDEILPGLRAAGCPILGWHELTPSQAENHIFVHCPYVSFDTTVLRFLQEAARDPSVLAIQLTIYRTSSDSPIVAALAEAARRGKQVAVLVEITARFDEAPNIAWGAYLESEGVHVAYGVERLKTHVKLAPVVRDEHGWLRRYAHLGTGNYHAGTARLYEDLGILTADPVLCEDAASVFAALTGATPLAGFKEMLVAPVTLRSGFAALIRREVEHARAGRPCGIEAVSVRAWMSSTDHGTAPRGGGLQGSRRASALSVVRPRFSQPGVLSPVALLDLIRKGLGPRSEKRRERPKARAEARNVRLYLRTDNRRLGARSSFSDGVLLGCLRPPGTRGLVP